jgi:hypothetical protein
MVFESAGTVEEIEHTDLGRRDRLVAAAARLHPAHDQRGERLVSPPRRYGLPSTISRLPKHVVRRLCRRSIAIDASSDIGRRRGAALTIAIALSIGCGRLEYATSDGGQGGLDAADRDASRADGGPDARARAVGDSAVDGGADGGVCAESPCRLVAPQCGCATGEMCQRVIAGSTTRSCVGPGVTPAGQACAVSTDCEPGTGCLMATAGAGGQCQSWCVESASCAPGECMRLAAGTDVGLCASGCDPFGAALTGCPTDLACRLLPGARFDDLAAAYVTMCAPLGGAGELGTCTDSRDCAPGLFCDVDVCRTICRTMAECAVGETCRSLAPPATELGVCQ